MRESLYEYSLRCGREALLQQWHREKNGVLRPEDLSFGSHRKVWWKCSRGHEWESTVYSRIGGSGCPYCAGKRVRPGEDLKSLYPELAKQWHPTRNGSLRPEDYLPGSRKTVWWQCSCGHEWQALIKSRTGGTGCPVCSNRTVKPGVNDLATTDPALARQWHPVRNGALTPDQVVGGSSRKVWWLCSRGHEWQAAVQSRSAGKGCPVCSGRLTVPGENDLKTHSPQVAAQWHPEKNGPLRPDVVSAYSNRQVWWRCSLGHEWKSSISSRTYNRSDCPYCAGRKVLAGFNDLMTLQPTVADQWHPTLNETLEPSMIMPGCRKKVWWKCPEGHVWKAVVYSRTGTRKCGCPICAGRQPRRFGSEFIL